MQPPKDLKNLVLVLVWNADAVIAHVEGIGARGIIFFIPSPFSKADLHAFFGAFVVFTGFAEHFAE